MSDESHTLGSLSEALDAAFTTPPVWPQPRDAAGRWTEAGEDMFGRPVVWVDDL